MAVPDFLIVGAAKAGTTSLHHYLSQHPQISLTEPKETFYFAHQEIDRCHAVGASYAPRDMPRTFDEYAARFVEPGPGMTLGEACVAYLYFPEAAQRIKAQNPGCKIIIILRDPAERAFSNYLHHVRDGIEPLPFRQALDAGPKRVADGWWFGFDYLEGSRYGRQVRRFLDAFPRENLLVLWYDDLSRDPRALVRAICTYVGVDPEAAIDTAERRNVSTVLKPGARPILAGLERLKPIARRVIPRGLRPLVARRVDRLARYKPELAEADRRHVLALLRDDLDALRDLLGDEPRLPAWLADPHRAPVEAPSR